MDEFKALPAIRKANLLVFDAVHAVGSQNQALAATLFGASECYITDLAGAYSFMRRSDLLLVPAFKPIATTGQRDYRNCETLFAARTNKSLLLDALAALAPPHKALLIQANVAVRAAWCSAIAAPEQLYAQFFNCSLTQVSSLIHFPFPSPDEPYAGLPIWQLHTADALCASAHAGQRPNQIYDDQFLALWCQASPFSSLNLAPAK
jgi:hypothetical protein